MVAPRTIPLPSSTAQPVAKPALSAELRTGVNPTTQPISDATVAKSIRDRGRYARCGLPASTRVQVQATFYDGAAVTVTVVSTPPNAAQDQCIAQAVREISWVREMTVRTVDVTFWRAAKQTLASVAVASVRAQNNNDAHRARQSQRGVTSKAGVMLGATPASARSSCAREWLFVVRLSEHRGEGRCLNCCGSIDARGSTNPTSPSRSRYREWGLSVCERRSSGHCVIIGSDVLALRVHRCGRFVRLRG
jgi:hypothetical protein